MSDNIEITLGADKSFHVVGVRKQYKILITQYPVTDVTWVVFLWGNKYLTVILNDNVL